MFKPGDYCKETNSLIIKEMFWEDIKKKLDEEDFGDQYSWVYDEELADFSLKAGTHKLWCVMRSNEILGTMWEKIE
jgi:hypothetical protein